MSIVFLGKAQNPDRIANLARRSGGLRAIHLHGWRVPALAWLLRAFLPEMALVWTIEAWPHRFKKLAGWVLWQAHRSGVEIVATTRALQWRILTRAGVRARYIPDGYEVASTPPIPPRRLGLWRGRYVVVVAGKQAEIDWVRRAHKKTGSRRKLVAVSAPTRRREQSLLAGAAVVLLADGTLPAAGILAAMEAGRSIIAVASPLLEELLGVTGQFIASGDEAGLVQALKHSRPSTKAQHRARMHFRWERIFQEYLPLYHQAVFTVPLDSARGILKTAPGW